MLWRVSHACTQFHFQNIKKKKSNLLAKPIFSILQALKFRILTNICLSFMFHSHEITLCYISGCKIFCYFVISRINLSDRYTFLQLYLWDESDYMPILVKNRAAEILFGNIKAEKVYSSYRQQMLNKNHDLSREDKVKDSTARFKNNLDGSVIGLLSSCPSNAHKSLQSEGKQRHAVNFNSYQIWLIFLKLLLQQGKNSPLKFEITVNSSLDTENGRFEMASASLPCYRTM